MIYHCEMADDEALDLLEAARDRIFVGPAIGLIHNTLYEAEAWGITRAVARDLGMERCIENSQNTYEQMRKRGIRVVIGGDYGFAWTPQGTNARDIEHFVKIFGYTPQRGAAVRHAHRRRADGSAGGHGQGRPARRPAGGRRQPAAGRAYPAGRSRLKLIMKDGVAHKNTLGEAVAARERRAA